MTDEPDNDDRNLRLWIVIGGLVVFAIVVTYAVTRGLESHWDDIQLGPLGTWVASLITVVAVIIALRQANLAQRQSEFAKTEVDRRWAEDVRQTQYTAVKETLMAVSAMRATIASMAEFESHSLAVIDLGEELESTYVLDRRRDAVRQINDCCMEARVALISLTDPKLRKLTRSIVQSLVASIRKLDTNLVAKPDWEAAFKETDRANHLSNDLQLAADSELKPPSPNT